MRTLLAAKAGGLDINMDRALELGSKDAERKELVKLLLNILFRMQFTFGIELPRMEQSEMPKVEEDAKKKTKTKRQRPQVRCRSSRPRQLQAKAAR